MADFTSYEDMLAFSAELTKAETYFPYLNRGAYKWIPDAYAATNGSSFGVMDAYNFAVCNHGRHTNMLAGEDAKYAFGTTIVCRGITSGTGLIQDNNVHVYYAGDITPEYIKAPFERKIRRGTNVELNSVPNPSVTNGFGFRYENVPEDPFFFFSTLSLSPGANSNLDSLTSIGGTDKISSVDVEYMLATSEAWDKSEFHIETNPPLAILAVIDESLANESETWLGTSRVTSEEKDADGNIISQTSWGPASEQIATDKHTVDTLKAIQTAIGSGELTGVFLPMYTHVEGENSVSSYPELAITHSSAYTGLVGADGTVSLDWGIKDRRSVNIKLSGSYWTSLSYFPKILGFLIMPNRRVFEGETPMDPQIPSQAWNSIISGLRVYDALQVNTVPEHTENKTTTVNGEIVNSIETVPSQLPCEVFGYAWRISHSVEMSKFTYPIQPARGKSLSSDPGTGLGDRLSSFYFKIYHPDIPDLGISHGVRFYYGLAVLAIPGTTPGLNSSLIGLMTSMVIDGDFLFVQYLGPIPGTQTLTFQFGNKQYGTVGKSVYSGNFGFAKETVAVRCGWAKGTISDPPSSIISDDETASKSSISNLNWLSLSDALPKTSANGTKVLFYDNDTEEANSKWYSFGSVNALGAQDFDTTNFSETYTGGLTTPLIQGSPQTNLKGPGAFGMSVSMSSSFIGPEKLTVYAKPKQYGVTSSLKDICSNDNNHLATFVSEVRNIGPDVQMYGGTWRIKVVAATDSVLKLNSQIFFRFFFIPEKYNGQTTDLTQINGSAIFDQSQLFEFHFARRDGNYVLSPGAPDMQDVIATPILEDQEKSYDLAWDCYFGNVGIYVSESDADDLFEKKMTLHLGKAMPLMEGTRLVVQAWGVNTASNPNLYNTSDYYNPEIDINYPAIEMSWMGETESMFQTMILETKSSAILPQQDPYVAGVNVESHDYITTLSCSESSESQIAIAAAEIAQETALANGQVYVPKPYRDYPLWANKISFENGQLSIDKGYSGVSEIGVSEIGLLKDSATIDVTEGRISLINFAIPDIADLIEEQAQIADMAIYMPGKVSSTIGGTSIGPTQFNVSFNYLTNNSTYNLRYMVELLGVAGNNVTTYILARSEVQSIDTSVNSDVTLPFSGNAAFSMIVNSSIVIPGTDTRLMLRFKIWPNKNREVTTVLNNLASAAKETGFVTGFTCVDIDGFNITMQPFEGLNNAGTSSLDIVVGALKQRGSSDWYEGLPTTTSRTFGSADYYFVADDDSLTTSIMPPLTMSQYGYWYLWGWLFSPFWFIQMPEGACIEIKDDTGLTAGNPVSGSNTLARERAQRVLMFRTAVGTLPLANLSADIDKNNKGILARQRLEVSGAASASNFLSVIDQVQSTKSSNVSHRVNEHLITIGDSIVSGKNPLIVTGSPNRKRLNYFYRGNTSTSYLFYEEDSFDIDTHASVVMLANYDGSLSNWHNPYGKRSAGTTNKIVLTNDMRLIGASADPMDFGIYVVGYRSNNLNNPADGGCIVLKKLHPGLVFGTDSAHVGPMIIVDGKVTEETYNVTSFPEVQPVLPLGLEKNNNDKRLNTFDKNSDPLPAAESFPDVIVDQNGNVYVFYTLLTQNKDQAKKALGKVFCRGSHNGGYWFDSPFPVADLGYNRLGFGVSGDDASFEAKHVVAVYSDQTKTYCLFFWANGKIFMRTMPHPGIDFDKFKVVNSEKSKIQYSDVINMLYMVEGDTSFTDGKISSALDQWLYQQWNLGSALTDEEIHESQKWYSSQNSYSVTGKQNNFAPNDAKQIPTIKILKYANAEDVPAQRVGALVNNEGNILIYYLNNAGQVVYKQIKIFGNGPTITPGLILSINTL